MNANGVRDPSNDQFGEACGEPGHEPGCPGMAGGDHELEPIPDDWFEDAEGFVREPLSYENNREGDPAFNGALDKW